ncbi:MAG: cache domain-containing protein [Thermodesulfobacteriota bacterium]|nr:cache domain-containing protein [Thermodesulfobacteriota bacterium]
MTTRKKRRLLLVSVILLIFFQIPVCAEEATYYYKRTKRVVSMLNDAVKEIEKKGEAAFPEFVEPDSRWFQGEMYLFIYTMKGVNIFHPVQKQLVGKNLYDLKDVNGRPLIQLLIQKAEEGGGWVHYMWTRPGEFIPTWKSGYVKKAVMPDGREVFVGTGVYNIRTEKQFIIQMVDDAVALIKKKKEAAFDSFRSASSPFSFRDSYIMVFKDDGTSVVDPAFPYLEGRNLLKYDIIKMMIARIKGKDSAWVSYLRPKPGDVNPSKKLAYLRAVTIHGQRYIVGADFFPPKPIWMR